MLQLLTSVIDNILYMYNSNTSLKDSCKHYAQIIDRIGPIRKHQARHPRTVFVYQIQAEGTLDQVVQACVEGKADVQYLLMEYCKTKKPHRQSSCCFSHHSPSSRWPSVVWMNAPSLNRFKSIASFSLWQLFGAP